MQLGVALGLQAPLSVATPLLPVPKMLHLGLRMPGQQVLSSCLLLTGGCRVRGQRGWVTPTRV